MCARSRVRTPSANCNSPQPHLLHQVTHLVPREDFLHLIDPDTLAIFSSHGNKVPA
jgi:hypothetical protein